MADRVRDTTVIGGTSLVVWHSDRANTFRAVTSAIPNPEMDLVYTAIERAMTLGAQAHDRVIVDDDIVCGVSIAATGRIIGFIRGHAGDRCLVVVRIEHPG